MSELCCLSATTCSCSSSKAKFFFIHLFSDLYLFFSFIFSHPLYLSYFIFFSPYLFKLFSFLSPLFLTTSLLLLALLANFISSHDQKNPIWDLDFSFKKNNNMGFLTSVFYVILYKFRSMVSDNKYSHITHDDDSQHFTNFEDSDVFKIVFDIPPIISTADESDEFQDCVFSSNENGNSIFVVEDEDDGGPIFCSSSPEKQPIKNGSNAERNKEIAVQNEKTTKSVSTEKCDAEKKVLQVVIDSSTSSDNNNNDKTIKNNGELIKVESSRTLDYNLGTYGSMRKEKKEWKRTLACKLFEERHNVVKGGGGEGMDLLWETYDQYESKSKTKSRNMNINEASKNKNKNKNKSYDFYEEIKEDEDEDEEEDEESNGQLCCLQAFKFSARKMNLGMGKPNLVKITKAIKGFGWLHKVSSSNNNSRRSKKVHNGD